MLSTKDPISLADIHSGLEKVFKVSTFLDFPLSLDEVVTYFLPGQEITADELRSLISRGSFADIPFQIQDDYLLTSTSQSGTSRSEREQISANKLNSATQFSRILTRLVPFVRTIAVTGSVAYGSARKWDDIDLFVVTEQNRLWLSISMALILARICKFLSPRPSHLMPFCLSYVHDEQGFAEDSFRNQSNPLFARELLRAKPVVGAIQYQKILEENDWVGKLYGTSYVAKMRELDNGLEEQIAGHNGTRNKFSFVLDWAEGVVFLLLSHYLRLRAYLMNLRLKSQGQELRVFEPRISPSSCVYTSNFYRWLHALWSEL